MARREAKTVTVGAPVSAPGILRERDRRRIIERIIGALVSTIARPQPRVRDEARKRATDCVRQWEHDLKWIRNE